MEHTLTSKDLTRFIYGETNAGEDILIRDAIAHDENLRTVYEELLAAKRSLDTPPVSPKQATIDRILRYSKESRSLETSK
jgi:hypothetical protein